MSDKVTLSVVDRVATLQLNRPESLNAVDIEMRRALHVVLDQVARDPAVGALVLTGAGKAFCSGADLKSNASGSDSHVRRVAHNLLHDYQPIFETISRLDKPVIAAVNGPAVGVGMSLALACDLVVMGKGAFLMAPFVNLGLIADGGVAWFLARRVGYARTYEMLVEGQKIHAERCLELGIANRVVDDDAVRTESCAWAASLSLKAPLAMALLKRVARLSMSLGLSEILTVEAELQNVLANTEDAREAIAAFAEKRTPTFRGR